VTAGSTRVAGQARRASADRQMVGHTAKRIGAASSGGGRRSTRVGALVVDAGEMGRAAGAGATAQDTGHTLANLLAVAVIVQPRTLKRRST
jgi:hypothetical protein